MENPKQTDMSGAAKCSSLGLAARAEGKLTEALAWQHRADASEPNNWGILTNLGVALQDSGKLDAAIAAFEQASLISGHPLPVANLGMAWLRAGRRAAGFRAILARWRIPEWPQQPYNLPCPHALPDASRLATVALARRTALDPVAGRLLIMPDQGYGDTLLALPFIRGLLRMYPDSVVLVKAPLLALARAALGDLTAEVRTSAEGPFSAWLTGFDIPAWLPEAIGDYEYERHLIETRLRQKCAPQPGSVVSLAEPPLAIAWRGNPAYALDRWRSMPAAVFAQGLAAGLTASGLARPVWQPMLPDASDAELAALGATGARIMPFRPRDFMETARDLLDCVALVTTDTSVVHLAGLLGVPSALLVCAFGDWRWGETACFAEGYPSVRLIRQQQPGEWGQAFEAAAAWVGSQARQIGCGAGNALMQDGKRQTNG